MQKHTPERMLKPITLIRWLESKPPKGTYDWGSISGKCLFSLYMFDHGYNGNPARTHPDNGLWHQLHKKFPAVPLAFDPHERGWGATFGAALERTMLIYTRKQ